ncbi:hypothetical protein JEW38_08515 [Pseudomonas aeruginosa]|nr:hypothetical protein [Pseudomonas aeruginosa]MBI9166665.1 hypothetical protein [Pseudomonas aeruginosa]
MTESKICTCPSGDGSLRWPCPAHPAVDQADVAAKLTFINGRPAMCGCQVEYSDGGGEYSDVIYVTLCAKHSGSAILDLVATNRIALTPEYEGQWHADLYLDREIPLAKVEGATPAEAVLALMSAERIDPEQESVEQAGGDERAAFEQWLEQHMSHHFSPELDLAKYEDSGEYRYNPAADYWKAWQARAALAQPSPKREQRLVECDACPTSGGCVEKCMKAPTQPSPAQAEAERPEVVEAYAKIGRAVEDSISRNLPDWFPSDCPSEVIVHLINERDATQVRVEELERELRDEENAHTTTIEQRDNAEYWADQLAKAIAERFGVDIGEHSNLNCPWNEALVWMQQPPAQAQHSVPGKYDDVLLPFLKSMEHELHANAGKGDRPGWLQMDRKAALLEIYYHLGKLQKATKGNDTAGIVEYAADVANMSMMLVDVCGLLAAAPGKEGV